MVHNIIKRKVNKHKTTSQKSKLPVPVSITKNQVSFADFAVEYVDEIVKNTPNITVLHLNCPGIDDSLVQSIFHNLLNLKDLQLSYCDGVTDWGLLGKRRVRENNKSKIRTMMDYSIANMQELEVLNINGAWELSDQSFIYGISLLEKLQSLTVKFIVNLTTDGIAALASGCPHLKTLYIDIRAGDDHDELVHDLTATAKKKAKNLEEIEITCEN